MSLTTGRARCTAGLLGALDALVAVPAAAEGASVRVSGDTPSYRANGSTERNQVRVSVRAGEFVVSDRVGRAGTGCRAVLRAVPKARRHVGRTLIPQVVGVDDDGTRQSFHTIGRVRVR